MEKYRQRLKRLRNKLEDLLGEWEEPFGFGILWPSPAAKISPATWELAEDMCKPYYFDACDKRLHRPKRWLDITPDGTFCVQWWGDKEGVNAFQKWAKKVNAVFREESKAAPQLFVPPIRPVQPASYFGYGPLQWEPPSGYYWTLNVLSMLATKNPHLTRTKERVLLDTSHIEKSVDVQIIPTRQRSLRDDDSSDDISVKIYFLEIEEDAITLGLRSLELLIEDGIPSLYVDVENGAIYVKGKPVVVDRLLARAVELLVAADGAWVSAKEIRRKLNLDEDDRIDRMIFKKLPRLVMEQIESSTFHGRRWRKN